MPLDLSAPKVITFSVAVIIALIAAIIHYAHYPICPQRVHAPVGRLFGPGCRQRASRIVGKAELIMKGRRPNPTPSPRGDRLPRKIRMGPNGGTGDEILGNTPFVRIPWLSPGFRD